MTESFPSTFPKGYRGVVTPGVNMNWTVFDDANEPIGTRIGKSRALEFAWKTYLNKLNYAGVATLLSGLQADSVVTELRQEIAAIRSAKDQKEARIAELQREVLESEGREKATSDCAEAALQSWKNEANEAHKKVEELEAELAAAKANLKRIGSIAVAAKKVSDTLIGCFENPVVPDKVTPAAKEPEPEPEPEPLDPAFDFDGPIPDGMPSGYRVEHLGDRKPMPYKVHGPGGLSITCFTRETAHEKAWEHIRDANKEQMKKDGTWPPKAAPKVATKPAAQATKTAPKKTSDEMPEGYTYEYTSSRYPHKVTVPDGASQYLPTSDKAVHYAWDHAAKSGRLKEPAGSTSDKPEDTKPADHSRIHPPTGYSLRTLTGHYRYALVRPDGKEEKFFTQDGAIEAAWRYHDEAKAKQASAPPTLHPALATSAAPPYGYTFTTTHRSNKYRLTFPNGRISDFHSRTQRYDVAWEHFRKNNPPKDPEPAKGEPAQDTPQLTLPPGFTERFLGPSTARPYKLMPPTGSPLFFKTPAELIEEAWKLSKAAESKTGPVGNEPPPGYTFSYDSNNKSSWKLELPGKQTIWFLSRQARLRASWIHHRAKFGEKMDSIRGMDKFPASFEHTLPDGYKKALVHGLHVKHRHQLTNPQGVTTRFSSERDLHDTAWEQYRLRSLQRDAAPVENRKRVPPGYTQAYGDTIRNYKLIVPSKEEVFFLSDEARLAAAWIHHDTKGDKMEAIRGMQDFPRGYQYRLPTPEYKTEKGPSSAANPWKLLTPGDGIYYLPSLEQARAQAWEDWRVAKNKAKDEKAKTPDTPKEDRCDVPPGYTNTFMGLSSARPYGVKMPNGGLFQYKSRAEMLKAAWADYDACWNPAKKKASEEKVENEKPKDEPAAKGQTEDRSKAPPGYKTEFHARDARPYRCTTPNDEQRSFTNSSNMMRWAWQDHDGAQLVSKDRVAAPEGVAEYIPGMMPPHYTHTELEDSVLRPHKVRGPDGYTDYFKTFPEALQGAWRHMRARSPNWAKEYPQVAPPPKTAESHASFSTTPMSHPDLPTGYKSARLHKTTEFQHMLKTPPGEAVFFRTWDDMVRWAAADLKGDDATRDKIVTSANKARLEGTATKPSEATVDAMHDASTEGIGLYFDLALLGL